jgi:hypothetical protein
VSRRPATAAVRAAVDSDDAHGAVLPPLLQTTKDLFDGFV